MWVHHGQDAKTGPRKIVLQGGITVDLKWTPVYDAGDGVQAHWHQDCSGLQDGPEGGSTKNGRESHDNQDCEPGFLVDTCLL